MKRTDLPAVLTSGKTLGAAWILLSLFFLWLDYLTGPVISFPILLTVPIAFAAWYNGPFFSIILIVTNVSLSGFLLHELWFDKWDLLETGINAVINLLIFLFISILILRVKSLTERLERRVKVLEGFLPICSFCKRIRDENNEWHQLEGYISGHSQAQFSHGVCPDCARKHYGFELKEK